MMSNSSEARVEHWFSGMGSYSNKAGEKKGELNTGALEWLVIPGKP